MTPRPLVVVVEPIDPVGTSLLEASARVLILDGVRDPRLRESLREADAVVVRSSPFGADLMDAAPRLRVIGRHGAGLDTIDLAHAERRGIRVVNTPRANAVSVAEYVLTVLLQLAKGVQPAAAALSEGRLPPGAGSLPAQVTRAGLVGMEVSGKRLGIAGFGAIGREVAVRAAAFGMVVTAFDPFLDEAAFRALGVARAGSLEELLGSSDVLTLHVPGASDLTIGARELALLPAGALLINSARGDVVDPAALLAAVRSGHLAGAALDVFDPEPPEPANPLLHEPRILATPHMAAMTTGALQRMAREVAAAVLEALG